MKKLLKNTLLLQLSIFIIFSTLTVKAQSNPAFATSLINTNLKFQMPAGYNQISTRETFDPTIHRRMSLMFNVIENKQKNIAIGIILIPVRKAFDENLKGMFPNIDANQSYSNTAKHEADTSVFKLLAFSDYELKKTNADAGFNYQLDMNRLFLQKYSLCKVIIIHKTDIGDAEICYFYNPENEELVKKEMSENVNILKFQDISHFKPTM